MKINKYIKLALHFLKLSWMREAEYRTNFMIWCLVDIGWTIIDIIFFVTLIRNIGAIGNWNLGESLIVIGVFRLLVIPVWSWMFQSFSVIPKNIAEGRLDIILVKPTNSQFLVSVQKFSFSTIPSIVGGTAFIIFGFKVLGHFPTPVNSLIFLHLLLLSIVLMYGVYFSTIASSLFFDRLGNIHHVFTSLFDASRFPKEIYGHFLRHLFTLIVPIALMTTVPSEALFGKLELKWIIWFHIITLLFFLLGKTIWNQGLKKYSSASS